MVTIKKVFTKGLKIPYLKTENGSLVYSSDIAEKLPDKKIQVVLSMSQLSRHVPDHSKNSKEVKFETIDKAIRGLASDVRLTINAHCKRKASTATPSINNPHRKSKSVAADRNGRCFFPNNIGKRTRQHHG